MATDLEVLGQEIKRAQYRNHRMMDTALREVGVSLVQWDALRAIARMPGASGHDLAVMTFQSDQAFGTLANRLVHLGMVVRTAGRGRRIEHTLTATGRQALSDGHDIAARVLDEVFKPIAANDRVALLNLLQRLTHSGSNRAERDLS